jgi:hypothetical protein
VRLASRALERCAQKFYDSAAVHSLTHRLPLRSANTPRQHSTSTNRRASQMAHSAGTTAPGRHRRAVLPGPQFDIAGGTAGRAARPQEPVAGRDGRSDRRREQHRHRETELQVLEDADHASFSAACRRSSSILRLLKPMEESSQDGCHSQSSWSQAQPEPSRVRASWLHECCNRE